MYLGQVGLDWVVEDAQASNHSNFCHWAATRGPAGGRLSVPGLTAPDRCEGEAVPLSR